VLAALLLSTAACTRDAPPPTFTPAPTSAPQLPATPTDLAPTAAVRAFTATPAPFIYEEADALFAGLCFESVFDAAGRVFVVRSADELRTLYDLADSSGLCARPVARAEGDWSEGRVLAGLWSRGEGCTARHTITHMVRDEADRQITLTVRLETEGACPYELVEPFWISIPDAQEYAIVILQ
jgi:hypothetical protein